MSAAAQCPEPVPAVVPVPRYDAGVRTGRVLVPGSEWWYLRVRGELDQQNRLLVRLAAAPQLPRGEWFHVRYRDPSDELRLRVRAAAADVEGLCRLAAACVAEDLATSCILDTYVREVERYGGLASTRIAESLFCAESAFVAAHLDLCPPPGMMAIAPGEDDVADVEIGPHLRDAAAFVDAYLGAGLGLAAPEVLALLEGVVAGYRREFPGESAALRRAVAPLARRPGSAAADAAADALAAAVRGAGRQLDACLRAAADEVQRLITLRSLVHMLCNRMGLDRRREYQVAFLLLTQHRAAAHRAGR